MYTELIFGASLKSETPEHVIQALKYMIGIEEKAPEGFVWEGRNPLRGGSFSFGLTASVADMYYNRIRREWEISVRSSIKDYDGDIYKFLDWIRRFISRGSGLRDMYAIVIYEEDEVPVAYYLHD